MKVGEVEELRDWLYLFKVVQYEYPGMLKSCVSLAVAKAFTGLLTAMWEAKVVFIE